MIPEFPNFKKLELSDKEDVEKFTLKYKPYSDINFAGTWSWDVRDLIKISQLNGNYVIRFSDYLTGDPFYTFLGENSVTDTVKKILDFSINEGLKPELRMVPEESIKKIDSELFCISEDINNFDYIYDTEELKNYKGGKFESKRGLANRFLRNNPEVQVRTLSLKDEKTKKDILELNNLWIKIKHSKESTEENSLEFIVIEKFFSGSDSFNLLSLGFYLNNKMIAFCIYELLPSEYAVSHLVKADNNTYPGIYAFLMQKSAEILFEKHKKYLNFEQDLGIDELRLAKTLFRPSFFLKKYIVTYKQ